jgi:hypothetical protein
MISQGQSTDGKVEGLKQIATRIQKQTARLDDKETTIFDAKSIAEQKNLSKVGDKSVREG